MKKFLFLSLLPFFGFAQKNIFLNIDPVFNNQAYIPQVVYMSNNGQNVSLDYLKYYLSDISITHDGGQVLDLSETVYLIDDTNHTVYLGSHNVTTIEQVHFLIGVPSRFNTQAGALAQDISTYDPSNALSFQSPSMYWGWAAGYMHMIVAGKADGNNDQIPDAYFELHNLGNHNQQALSFTSVQQTNTNAAQIDLNFICQVDHWLNGINLSTVGVLHDETGINAQIMQNVITKSVFAQAANAGVQSLNPSLLQFSSMSSGIQCAWTGLEQDLKLNLVDASGKIIRTQSLVMGQGQVVWTGLLPGMYFVQFTDAGGQAQSRQVLVF
ncbi:MAG: MbnP family protein [Flavobacteriales bacterium]